MVGFRGTVESFHSPTTASLQIKDGGETGKIQLHQLIEQVGLRSGTRFNLHPLYFSGEVQTLALYVNDYSKQWESYYGRRLIELPDGGVVSADFVIPKPSSVQVFKELATQHIPQKDWPKLHPRTRFLSPEELTGQASDDSKPLVVVNHGLAGGSHEPIIRALTYSLSKNGFEVVVLNSRGCSRTKIYTPELFSALATDDLRFFVKWLRETYPNRPFYSIGFSFGAAILTNFLGEEGNNSPFVAASVLSNPWDLTDSAYHIGTRFWSKKLFLGSITSTLTRLVKSNKKVLLQNPLFTEELINAHYDSPADFDSSFTARIYGFQTAFHYYRAASPVNRLLKVQTPLLAINSFDDPVVGVYSIPIHEAKANPNVVLLRTDLGGHLSYLQYDGESWAVNKIVEFLTHFNEKIDLQNRPESNYEPSIPKYHNKLQGF